MKNKIVTLLAIILLLAPIAFSQSRETGAIRGVVTDEQSSPLPGVNVTLSGVSLMGTRAAVTDANGEFRFPAVPPGEFALKFELQGFGTLVREKIRVTTTTTLTFDVQLKPATVSEEVTVVAQSPTVDVKSTETASVTLSNEILRNMPNNQFTSNIVNMAPGVNNDVAFGASSDTGIAYSMDGVNVADPDAGSAWVFSDYNVIEEAKVMGIGLPAEYGNFTGVIFNLVTKSGGNNLSGHFEFDFQGYQADSAFWQANNNQAYAEDWPELTSPSSKLMDVNGHLGGPIVKDKLWFYTGGQFYRTQNRPTGFPEDVDYKQPRFFAKITSQLTPSLNMNLAFQRTKYEGTNRNTGSTYSPETGINQHSPDWLASFSLTKILSPKTFFDLKANYFEGIYYLDPEVGLDTYAHFVLDDNMLYDSAYYYYYADRSRFGTNASMTHYAEDFLAGSHEFKFGAEFERSMVRNRYGHPGTGGPLGDHIYYIDYYSYGYTGPYLAYQYAGYDKQSYYTRLEAFVQDNWQVSKRLNLSLGVRFSQNWGQVKGVDGNVYNTNRVAPRLGFTFDILGDKTTILKAHYGQFTEGMFASYHDMMNPPSAFSDKINYIWNLDTEEWDIFEYLVHPPYVVDPDIQHPYMTQWTVGIERELFKDTSLSVTYIDRLWNNLVGHYDTLGVYEPVEYYSSALDQTFTVYERTEDTLETYSYRITNLENTAEFPNVLLDPYRKFKGVEVLFNKRFSNRWQLLASYVYGKATGTYDNGMADDIGYGGTMYDPNFWINGEGNVTYDPTHMIKLQGTYVLPLDINFNFYLHSITGTAWTTRVRTRSYNQGRITFFAEPRGSNHYDMATGLDLRLEKVFTLAKKYRLGLMVDIFNVFNDDSITSWGTRAGYDWNLDPSDPEYPTSTAGHDLYGFTRPRQARVGIRLIF